MKNEKIIMRPNSILKILDQKQIIELLKKTIGLNTSIQLLGKLFITTKKMI